MGKLADRVAERTRSRVEALAMEIAERGFAAAEEYARSAFDDSNGPLSDLRLTCAITLIEDSPEDAALADPAIDAILRKHCSEAIAAGESLSPALSDFAAKAIQTEPQKAGKGRRAAYNAWQKLVVIQVITDLQEAGIPAYHGKGTLADALFYGTDAVASALDVSESTVRSWWKGRGDI